jgi:hypothetical protein
MQMKIALDSSDIQKEKRQHGEGEESGYGSPSVVTAEGSLRFFYAGTLAWSRYFKGCHPAQAPFATR